MLACGSIEPGAWTDLPVDASDAAVVLHDCGEQLPPWRALVCDAEIAADVGGDAADAVATNLLGDRLPRGHAKQIRQGLLPWGPRVGAMGPGWTEDESETITERVRA